MKTGKKKKNNGTFGIIVAGRIREGQGVAEIYPSRPDRKIYSALLSKDNRLFILSARSKQELENLAKIRVGPLCYLHSITTTFSFFLYPLIQLSFSYLVHFSDISSSIYPLYPPLTCPELSRSHKETWLSIVIWQLMQSPDHTSLSWPIIACRSFSWEGGVRYTNLS